MTGAPKIIYIQKYDDAWNRSQSNSRMYDDDDKFYRADRYHACMEAGCSLHYHLFEIIKAEESSDVGCDEMEDLIDDAQLALDKWNRFLDGKEE